MQNKNIQQYAYQLSTNPEQMDLFWALGWRHFGYLFFRYSEVEETEGLRHVQPVRIDLQDFKFSDSQKKILRKNADLTVAVVPTIIDEEKNELFELHKVRFEHNIPDTLYDFLSYTPATEPCQNLSIELRKEGKLVAVSFLDIGEKATSSVYAMFHPEESKRSLGIFTMLLEIKYSIEHQFNYFYLGYTYTEPSFYDYKKKFTALEYYDWEKWKKV